VTTTLDNQLGAELDALREARTYKSFLTLESAQGAVVQMAGRGEVIVLSSNNYLGLAGHPEVVRAGIEGLERYGAGTASVRFICGTFEPHLALERALADLSGTEAALTYVSCWNANEACIPSLTDETTVILTDELNHASLIDAIRLSRPGGKVIYPHSDMTALRDGLAAAPREARKLIVTDGVFSMDGYVAPLREICDLADRHDAMVMVDDSHAVGFVGPGGRGTPELHGVMDRVDIVTGTLGKALGGASGGYVAARAEIVALLRQRSRPYLFSNTLAPVIAAASLKVLDLLETADDLRTRLAENTALFRRRMTEAGFDILPGDHAIAPVMIGDATVAGRMAELLLERGVYVIGFSYPVVPQDKARIRVQLSAAHSTDDVNRAVDAFVAARAELVG